MVWRLPDCQAEKPDSEPCLITTQRLIVLRRRIGSGTNERGVSASLARGDRLYAGLQQRTFETGYAAHAYIPDDPSQHHRHGGAARRVGLPLGRRRQRLEGVPAAGDRRLRPQERCPVQRSTGPGCLDIGRVQGA